MNHGHHVVTGAFGYSGAVIARELLRRGEQVVTLTDHPRPGHALAGKVEAHPFCFEDPARLVRALRGAAARATTMYLGRSPTVFSNTLSGSIFSTTARRSGSTWPGCTTSDLPLLSMIA